MGSGADKLTIDDHALKAGTEPIRANQRQVGGDHYKNGSKMEHWDIVVAHQLDYFQAQILRYVMRHKKKNGLEDLKKAQHFIQKYIEIVETASTPDSMARTEKADETINMARAFLASTI